MCATVYNSYNISNNNYLFVILLTQLFAILLTSFPLDQYSGDHQTTTVLFTLNASSLKTDWITTNLRLLCLAFLYFYIYFIHLLIKYLAQILYNKIKILYL